MYTFHQEQFSYSLLAAHSQAQHEQREDKMLKAARSRAKSWVMTTPNRDDFIKLPNERVLYTSPPRTSLALSTVNNYPGCEPFSVKCDNGVVYVTNQRIVFLPTSPTPQFSSFSSPILSMKDAYVRAPFFGANYWVALVRPVAGGGVPALHPYIELRLTFREGGAYDYHTVFEQIKDRLHQAADVGREHGGIDYHAVHLEQLPAYAPAADQPSEPRPHVEEQEGTSSGESSARDSGVSGVRPQRKEGSEERFEPPNEPPPDYEEAQAQAITVDFDERLRREADTL